QRAATLRDMFGFLPWSFLFVVPAVCMKMWAEERKIGTFETLLTMPLSEVQIVLGKFLAAFGLVAVALALTFPLPVIVGMTAASSVDFGPIVGGYIGALFLGAAYVAICLFASAITESQIVAFILGAFLAFGLALIGSQSVAGIFPSAIGELLQLLSLQTHFMNIERGVVDSRDVLDYLSVLTFFLMLNVAAVKRR
ncbi:MAG: ABC transporter permease subunit, partial [Planctomycetes bacterium]|nr:ABC transporter permease subunit [Planctomycetota bacterium]